MSEDKEPCFNEIDGFRHELGQLSQMLYRAVATSQCKCDLTNAPVPLPETESLQIFESRLVLNCLECNDTHIIDYRFVATICRCCQGLRSFTFEHNLVKQPDGTQRGRACIGHWHDNRYPANEPHLEFLFRPCGIDLAVSHPDPGHVHVNVFGGWAGLTKAHLGKLIFSPDEWEGFKTNAGQAAGIIIDE